MKISKVYVIVLILSLLAGGLIARSLFPKTVDVVVRIPEPVIVNMADSTQADFEEKVAARDAMIERQRRSIAELASRPPVVTAETTFVERRVEVPVTQPMPPQWRVIDLTVGQDVQQSTVVRLERLSSDGQTFSILPQTEQHVSIGPLLGAFPRDDGLGYRLEFGDWPRDNSCGFGCTLGHLAIGAAVGAGATGLACAFLGGGSSTDVFVEQDSHDYVKFQLAP